jgi:hypothetical protein
MTIVSQREIAPQPQKRVVFSHLTCPLRPARRPPLSGSSAIEYRRRAASCHPSQTKKRRFLSQLFLCLSRACLGTTTVLMSNGAKKGSFFRTSAANLKSSWNFDKTGFFGVFPNVCPEPVLVKSSFLYINGSKSPFSYRYGGEERGNDVENRAPDVHQLHAVVDQLARISTCSEQEILRC